MKTDLVTLPPSATVEEAVKVFIERRVGTLPIIDEAGKILGVLTMASVLERAVPEIFDLLRNFDFVEDLGALEFPSEEVKSLLLARVSEVMDREPHMVSTDCSILCAINFMEKHNLRDLVIEDDGRLVGLISPVDLGRAFLQWIQDSSAGQ
jgi:CBS domain-containing protein